LLAVAALAGAVGVYGVFYPPDRVRVFVEHLPAGTRFVCLVASGDDGSQCLDWSPSNELGIPFAMHPAKCVWSYTRESDPSRLDWDAYVRWVPAREYGVVVRCGDGQWQAVWFSAAEVTPGGVWGGRAAFDCAGRAVSPVPEATAREIGLGGVTITP
jgi:hypothetical protein